MRDTGDRDIDEQLRRFGQNIRDARERAGLAQDDLGIDRAAISFLERAERSPDLPTVVRVAHAVGVTPAALLKGVGEGDARVRGPRHDGDAGTDGSPAAHFGINLRWGRERVELSQEALALKADVDRAAISVFEHGRRDPNLLTLLKLARAMEIRPAVLLNGVEAQAAPAKSAVRRPARRRASGSSAPADAAPRGAAGGTTPRGSAGGATRDRRR
jgi:transcriptional regulator with XRE-family HTH domain